MHFTVGSRSGKPARYSILGNNLPAIFELFDLSLPSKINKKKKKTHIRGIRVARERENFFAINRFQRWFPKRIRDKCSRVRLGFQLFAYVELSISVGWPGPEYPRNPWERFIDRERISINNAFRAQCRGTRTLGEGKSSRLKFFLRTLSFTNSAEKLSRKTWLHRRTEITAYRDDPFSLVGNRPV